MLISFRNHLSVGLLRRAVPWGLVNHLYELVGSHMYGSVVVYFVGQISQCCDAHGYSEISSTMIFLMFTYSGELKLLYSKLVSVNASIPIAQ